MPGNPRVIGQGIREGPDRRRGRGRAQAKPGNQQNIGDFTVTSFAVSRGHPAPLVGKRLLAGGLRVYFCLYSCLVYINFAHTQDHDYVLYLCGGTSGVVWTACFSLLSSKKMENEENSG